MVAALGGTASEGVGAFSLLQLVHDEPQRQLAQALQEALREALLLADGHRSSFEGLRCAAGPTASHCWCWQMGTGKALQTEGCSNHPIALHCCWHTKGEQMCCFSWAGNHMTSNALPSAAGNMTVCARQ